jgi:hypothetical protein
MYFPQTALINNGGPRHELGCGRKENADKI